MDRGYNPKQFVGLFNSDIADRQIKTLFSSEFGPLRKKPRGGQCSQSINKKVSKTVTLSFVILTLIGMEVVIDYEYLTGAKGETVFKELSVAA